jgi:putative transposase
VRQTHQLTESRACGLIGITRWSNRYQSREDRQVALRLRLRELAGIRVRYGYRRLTILLRREGWTVNAKRVYRLYRQEGLQVRSPKRRKCAVQVRVALPGASRPNQRWSMDFVSDRFADGRWFRILTVVDQYTRECLCVHAERSQTGKKVAEQLSRIITRQGPPESHHFRQRQRVRRQGDGSLVISEWCETRVYSARQACGEWLCREL